MRFRELFLYLCAAFGPLVLFYQGWMDLASQRFRSMEIHRDDARREAAVILNGRDWCEFQIPRQATHVRVLTNASVKQTQMPEKTQSDPREGWRYSIEYEWVDADGNVFGRETYHFRSRVIQVEDAVSGRRIHPTFVGKSARPATQTRVLHLALRGSREQATRIRMRLKSRDAAIDEVLSRVTARVPRPDYDSRTTWNRLSHERRNVLCRYCVYDYYLLSDRERANLLKWQWTETPTVGEFATRYLYFVANRDSKEVDDRQIPAGRFGSRDWVITAPLPEQRGQVTVEMHLLESDPTSPATRIRWYGSESPRTETFEVPAARSRYTMIVAPGMLRIEPGTDMVVRLYWRPVDVNDQVLDVAATEITPGHQPIRTFVVDHRHVDYEVSHVEQRPTPLRVSLRRVFDASFHSATSRRPEQPVRRCWVNWQYLAQGRVVRQGIVPVDPKISMYDYLWFGGQPRLVSDVTTWYFNVPPEVDGVRLMSDGTPLLVNASVRPPGLPRAIMVPEDYGMTWGHESRYRAWFAMRPVGFDQLLRENRALSVRAQSRPPVLDPQIVNGHYDWHRFEPDGATIQQRLWVPVAEDASLRPEAMVASWQPIPSGEMVAYRPWSRDPFASPKDVRLAWCSRQARPGHVRVHVGDHVVVDEKLGSKRGELRIPLASFDQHRRLRIEASSDVTWWVNGLDVEGRARWIQRDAARLENGTIVFHYDKRSHDDEALTLLTFPDPEKARDRLKVRIRISPTHRRSDGPISDWTLTDRIYDVRSDGLTPALSFDSGHSVGTGHRCFVHLNADLPPGRYTITVDVLEGPPSGHVVLYQSLPGDHPQREWKWVRRNRSEEVQ